MPTSKRNVDAKFNEVVTRGRLFLAVPKRNARRSTLRMPWPRRVASFCRDIFCQCRSDVGETLVTVRRRHRRCRLSPAGPVGALRAGEHPSFHEESACHCARASGIPRVALHDEPHRMLRVIPANLAPPTHHVTTRSLTEGHATHKSWGRLGWLVERPRWSAVR